MDWTLIDTELLLLDEHDHATRIDADTILSNATEQNESLVDAFERLSIAISRRYLDPFLMLEESDSGAFGALRLFVRNTSGRQFPLSSTHKSNHAVINGRWHKFNTELFGKIESFLNKNEIRLSAPINLDQYLQCKKQSMLCTWVECKYEADTAALSQDSPIETNDGFFTGTLTDYQVVGCNWLSFMSRQSSGMILGDGMGLGKTIQVIKLICDILSRKSSAKILVICPSALMENWAREIDKFSQAITVEKYSGPNRDRNPRELRSAVTITTYDTARIDLPILQEIPWELVVLDEAQNIKNPSSARAKAIKRIPRHLGIAVTGTPFENHLTDVWSLVDFCIPGLLSSEAVFNQAFKDDGESASALGKIIAPLLLRRTINDIENDLPPLVQLPMPIELERAGAEAYERLKNAYSSTGQGLGTIQKLIGHLSLPKEAQGGISNLKFEYLESASEEIFGANEKMIVFASRNATIDHLATQYSKTIPIFVLNGDVEAAQRQLIVDEFSKTNGGAMLICNPRVGGAGLNIAEANHVFHFSAQWNPAIIDQADARAHRRGQRKTVFAHYPYYAKTIEEYMWDKIAQKRELSDVVAEGNDGRLNLDEISKALALNPLERNR